MEKALTKREQALLRVKQIEALRDVERVEPRALTRIINEALDTLPEEKHWQAYERLKATAKTVVGFDAVHGELSTRGHYEAMLGFIEWLLPETQEEKELLEFDEPLYDDEAEPEPAFVPRSRAEVGKPASRIISGFVPLGQIIESTLNEAEQIDVPNKEQDKGEEEE